MLNYVWTALIILGLAAALTTDIQNKMHDPYKNGTPIPVTIVLKGNAAASQKKIDANIIIHRTEYAGHFNEQAGSDIMFQTQLDTSLHTKRIPVSWIINNDVPSKLTEIAKASGKENDITGELELTSINSQQNVLSANLYFEEVSFVKMKDVTSASLHYAETAVEIALGLIGIMALWLGIMKIAEDAGIIRFLAKGLRPLTRFLFPDVPADHPAIGSIVMNISANILGLGNAATPFGLKAMEELDTLNKDKGTATNAMCTFLAINTAGMTLIPATAIALRATAGSSQPAIIIGTSLFGSFCATIVGILSAKILENFPLKGKSVSALFSEKWKSFVVLLGIIAIPFILVATGLISMKSAAGSSSNSLKDALQLVSIFAIPFLILFFIGYGMLKKVKVYEKFIEGAKEGFNIAIRIIPYLVAMLVAIGIFRSGGAMDWLIYGFRHITDPIGMPAEALPMALMRPLSGSGALGVMAEIMSVHGPDSFIGVLTSTFYGSSETTFYVLAVYFGAVNIKRTRHALAAGLLADVAGVLGALFIVRMLFGV